MANEDRIARYARENNCDPSDAQQALAALDLVAEQKRLAQDEQTREADGDKLERAEDLVRAAVNSLGMQTETIGGGIINVYDGPGPLSKETYLCTLTVSRTEGY